MDEGTLIPEALMSAQPRACESVNRFTDVHAASPGTI